MTAFMHDVARAALPVAIGLLVLAATARAALWANLDERAHRLAAQYLDPLATWSLVALATHTLALGLAGEAALLAVALPLALGAVAVVLRASDEAPERPAAAPEPAPPAGDRLGADPVDDESTRRTGLWSRA